MNLVNSINNWIMVNMIPREQLEDYITEIEQELGDAINVVDHLKARLESLYWELNSLDTEEF